MTGELLTKLGLTNLDETGAPPPKEPKFTAQLMPIALVAMLTFGLSSLAGRPPRAGSVPPNAGFAEIDRLQSSVAMLERELHLLKQEAALAKFNEMVKAQPFIELSPNAATKSSAEIVEIKPPEVLPKKNPK